MKIASIELTTLLAEHAFFVAELYTITLASGEVVRFTSGDGDIRAAEVISVPYTILLHFDADQTLDSSGNGNVVTASGAGVYSAAPVFGSGFRNLGSGAVGDCQTMFPETALFDFGSNDFTMRFRAGVSNSYSGKTHTFFSNGYGLTLNWLSDTGQFIILVSTNGTSNSVTVTGSITLSFAQFSTSYHAFSIEVYAHYLYFYIDGVLVCTPTLLAAAIYHQLGRTMAIGGLGAYSTFGVVDEFMIYNGVSLAQGASSYTVETAAYPDYAVVYHDYLVNSIERNDITLATGVNVDETTVSLYCNADPVFSGLSVPNFALIGGFDNAHIKIELAIMPSYGDVSAGVLHLFEGKVTDIKIDISKVDLTVSSESIRLDTQIPSQIYQPSCNHTLYDSGCALSRAAFTGAKSVLSGSTKSQLVFTDSNAVGFFELGKVVMTLGLNNALIRTVKFHTAGLIVFTENLPFTPAIGDTFTATAGCNKLRSTCTAKFNNAVHFLGWEYMPAPETSL